VGSIFEVGGLCASNNLLIKITMKKFSTGLFLITYIFCSNLFAQDNFCNKFLAEHYLKTKGEVYFKFEMFDKARVNSISSLISIDNFTGGQVFAYANINEFEEFLKLNIPYWVLEHPGDINFDPKMKSNPDEIMEWDSYPTYEGYVAMMNQFASAYPSLCRIVNAGTTVQGRQILFAVVSDNVNTPEAEPKFMYTSSMHGDETTGYILNLRLINYLLTNYNTDPKVTNLVNNIEIWINPLHNPDGTYHGGNSTVNGAIRGNANNIDLNRNYPGVDYYGTPNLQPEINAFMNLANSNYFRLSVNFHGGVEVCNYPWDTWSRLCTDDAWWVRVCRKYADTVHTHAVPGYMTYLNNGITNGYAWYYVHGSRQDWQIYYKHGREQTIELSNTKLLPPAQLPNLWEYNYRSMLNFMEQVLYGINGTVTDSITNLPVKAKVTIAGFDADSSEVYSDSTFGKYYRMIIQGTYNLTFSAPGYYSKTINGVSAINDAATVLNVKLMPTFIGISGNTETPNKFELGQNYPNPFNPKTVISFQLAVNSYTKLVIYDVLGNEIETLVSDKLQPGMYKVTWDASNYPSGVYYYRISSGDPSLRSGQGYTETKKMILIK
jgi:zinc carboxypeptidase/carboxypeptidase family protein/type IX secretion system substrate protein